MSGNINLGSISAGLTLAGGVDVNIDELANALTTGIRVDAGLGNVGLRVTGDVDVGLDNVRVDAGLDNLRIKELAPIGATVSVKDLPVIQTDSRVDLGLDDIRLRELPPVKLELSVSPLRMHLPLSYSFCLEIFGIRLFRFSLCGEGMAIAEDYEARPAERCGG